MSDPTHDQVPAATDGAGLDDDALGDVAGGLLPLTCPKCGQDIVWGHSCG